jgi:glycosyltransferase involved in cell wall biosynthesis
MNPLQVALLTPVFWPVANQTLASVRELADAWRACGAEVTIFTERLEPDWASRIGYREMQVVRLERPAARPWSRGRFGKVLVKALADFPADPPRNTNRWDAVVICGWQEALLALDGASERLTDRLYFWTDRPLLQSEQRAPQVRVLQAALQQCSAILSSHPQARRLLEPFSEGLPEVCFLPEVGAGEDRVSAAEEDRERARKSLADVHPLLNFERNQLVGLCAAEMSGDSGWFDLLTAWRHLRREEPRAQLVVVGDGPQARAIWGRIYDWHLQGNVVMPGCFDDLAELLQAADFYVHPLRSELTCPLLSRAMVAGQACLISKSNPLASSLVSREEALLFTPGNVSELTGALKQISGDPTLRQKLGADGARAFTRVANREHQEQLLRNLIGATPRDLSGVPR